MFYTLLSIVLTPLYWLIWGLLLVFFHAAQWLALHVWGERARRHTASLLNWALLRCLLFLGIRVTLDVKSWPPEGKPLIIVSNHQNQIDISGISWALRRYVPIFVSKSELGRGLPSISYNLRHSGAALIDRDDPRQALREIGRLGKLIQEESWSAVIFPEGTRSRDGVMKPFAAAGIKVLLKNAPDAWVVPVAIDGAWRMGSVKNFPLVLGHRITWTVLPAISREGQSADELVAAAESAIREHLGQR
ncbi:MAG: 1-acyl-sn-glycerol-3-phosphate acyltransferase [Pseudomonadales bacterium]|nr:1-acyl-sn-glycerol-3-phosphate acyltransferase [Pseudomonadales bacterium]